MIGIRKTYSGAKESEGSLALITIKLPLWLGDVVTQYYHETRPGTITEIEVRLDNNGIKFGLTVVELETEKHWYLQELRSLEEDEITAKQRTTVIKRVKTVTSPGFDLIDSTGVSRTVDFILVVFNSEYPQGKVKYYYTEDIQGFVFAYDINL